MKFVQTYVILGMNKEQKQRPQRGQTLVKKKKSLRINYKKCIGRIKRYRGVTSIVISVRGELYDTTLEKLHVADYINYKFNAIANRARRDVKDIDPLDDVKCIRVTTLYYEAIIGLGGKPDREFMIFVTQKTPESIQRPPTKPKLTSVFLKPTDPMKQQRSRKDPVKQLQLDLFGITTDAAEQKIVQQQLDETRAVKIAELETTRKYDIRVKHLAKVTSRAVQAVKPVRAQQVEKIEYFRRKGLEKRERERSEKTLTTKLPDIPKKEEQIDDYTRLGYFKPRRTRKVDIYDDAGYKVRGDVNIGYRPHVDTILFPMKKTIGKTYKPSGVFHRKSSNLDRTANTSDGQSESVSKKEEVQDEDDDDDEFQDI